MVVACNAIEGGDTVSDAFVEGERTGEYIVHAGHSVRVMRRGKAGVGDIIFGAVVKEGVLYS